MNDEKSIIEACQKGDREQFALLYDHYVKRIYRFIYFKVLQKETAEDLTSKAFLKALQGIHTFDPERNFSAWIYSIARNTVIDHFRKERSSIPIEDVWDLAGDTHAKIETDAENRRKFREVEKHLKALTPEQREIVILRIWEDMSYREIATAIGKSEDNCKVIFSRAIAKLRSADAVSLLFVFLTLMKP